MKSINVELRRKKSIREEILAALIVNRFRRKLFGKVAGVG